MGGGGSTIRLLTITHKRLFLALPKMVTFSFYLLRTFWQNFSKISSSGGDPVAVFEMRRLRHKEIFWEFYLIPGSKISNHDDSFPSRQDIL